MSDLFENPQGTDGFDFVEYAAPDPQLLHDLFRSMGFSPVAKHPELAVTLYRQGRIDFLVNEEPDSFAMRFAAEHGPCACGFGIRVRDAASTAEQAAEQGGEAWADHAGVPVATPAIAGIGGSILYLVDRYGDAGSVLDHFVPIEGADQAPVGFGMTFVDHLTHNVYFGNMEQWSSFYERFFNFREIRYFDIKGAQTGLVSKAMTSPCGKVRIPINESEDPKSQINEYLDEYQGEGIQHIALFTDDIYATVEAMRERGIDFLDVPDTYYEMIPERIPDHGEDVERLNRNYILIDADPEHLDQKLLQIFTKTCIGPVFFEIIQRKGNEGFGEGNFQALFDSIERDQAKRGVL